MTEPSEASAHLDASKKLTERPHPLTPLIRGWVVLLALAAVFGREVLSWFTEDRALPSLPLLAAGVGAIVLAAIAVGLASWLTTRFVIDTDELRIETGILARKSQRIAFDKVTSIDVLQPLAARVFVLAELEIDFGSSDRVKLRYLSRARAYALRDYLLVRARGQQAEIADDPSSGLQFSDLTDADQVLVRLPPQRVVAGAVTSNEFIGMLLTMAITISAVAAFSAHLGGPMVLIALAISVVSGIAGFIGRRVTGQFNFTLSTRPAGLRISRGLASLTSQSLPARRVQSVRLSQSLLWRRFDCYRVEIDVLGVGGHDEDGANSSISSVLLPVADFQQVREVLALLWPRADYSAIELHPAPFRARWLHPLTGPFLAMGHDDLLVVSQHGWLERRWDLVPHARVQSVRIWQGPISRRLGLANLAFHTAGSHLSASARGLDSAHISQRQSELIKLAQAHRVDITADLGSTAQAGPLALRADHAEATISSIE